MKMDQDLKIEQTLERIGEIIAKRTEIKKTYEKSENRNMGEVWTNSYCKLNCTKCGGTTWILIKGKARRCSCFGKKNSEIG